MLAVVSLSTAAAAASDIVSRSPVVTAHYLRQRQVTEFTNVSRLTLLVYDIILMFGREKRYIWDAKFRLSTVLYLLVRYPVIVFQVYQIWLHPTSSSCDALDKFSFMVSISLSRVAIAASFILRVYAVMDRGFFTYLCVAFLSLVGLLSVALDIVQVSELSCTATSNPLAFVLTFLTLIIFDVLTVVLIGWRIWQMVRDAGGLKHLSAQMIMSLIIRSGALYFATVTGLQVTAVILYYLPQGVYSTALNNFLTVISTILVSRFLLDLREMMAEGSNAFQSTAACTSHLDSVRFAGGLAHKGTFERSTHTNKPGHGLSIVRDFEDMPVDTHENGDVYDSAYHDGEGHGWSQEPTAVPMEVLARRAREVEVLMDEG